MSEEAGQAVIPIDPDLSQFGTKLVAQMKPQLAAAEQAAGASGSKAGSLLSANASKEAQQGFKQLGASLGADAPQLQGMLGELGSKAGKEFSTNLAKQGNAALKDVFESEVSAAAQKAGGEAEAALSRLGSAAGKTEGQVASSLKGLGSAFKGVGSDLASAFGAGGTLPGLSGLLLAAKSARSELAGVGETAAGAEGDLAGVGAAAGEAGIGLGGIAAAAAAAGTGVIVALRQAANSAADYEEGVLKIQHATGATAEQSSLLAAQLDHVGISVDTGARAFTLLDRNIESGSSHLNQYFSAAQLATLRSGDFSKILPVLKQQFDALQNPMQQTAFLMNVFGRSGAQMRELFEQSADSIKAVNDRAKELGLVFTQQQLEAARQYGFATNDLGTAFKGMEIELGKGVIPAMTKAVEIVTELITKGTALAKNPTFDRLAKDALHVLEVVNPLGTVIGLASNALGLMKMKSDAAGEAAAAQAVDMQALNASIKAGQQDLSAWSTAGTAFDQTLSALVPDFSQIPSLQQSATQAAQSNASQIASATKTLAAAQDSLQKTKDNMQAQDFLTATGQDQLRQQQQAVADAQAALDKLHSTPLAPTSPLAILQKQTKDNATALQQFDALIPQLQGKLNSLGKDPSAVQNILFNLNKLGPAGVPLLQQLVKSSNASLGQLVDNTSQQIVAAKKAADFQFDQWPANFSGKMLAAAKAAGKALDQGVAQWQFLKKAGDTNQADFDALAQQISGNAQQLLSAEQAGIIKLSDPQTNMLQAITSDASTATSTVGGLADKLSAIKGTWAASVTVDTSPATKTLGDLQTTFNGLFQQQQGGLQQLLQDIALAASLAPTPASLPAAGPSVPPGAPPLAPSATSTLPKRHAAEGGIVPAGHPTWVLAGEAGKSELFAPLPLEGSDLLHGARGSSSASATVHIENLHLTTPQDNPSTGELVETLSNNLGWRLATLRRS